MARFLILWRQNPWPPWPTDPSEFLEQNEAMMATIGELLKNGELEEFGWFQNGTSGYAISKGDAVDNFMRMSLFQPFILAEVHEIIPFKKGKEIMRAVLKSQIEAAKK